MAHHVCAATREEQDAKLGILLYQRENIDHAIMSTISVALMDPMVHGTNNSCPVTIQQAFIYPGASALGYNRPSHKTLDAGKAWP
jgi:hypothetical protein